MNFVDKVTVPVSLNGIELVALKKLSLVSHALAQKIGGRAGDDQKCLATVLDDVIRQIEINAAKARPMTDIVDRLRDTACDREPFTPAHAECRCRIANEAANRQRHKCRSISYCGQSRAIARGNPPSRWRTAS